jgi:hypothetical protein
MAVSTITTESGDTLMAETVAGIPLASSLNDISVVTINKEHFDSDPVARSWLVGTDWVWDSVNQRMKIA